MDCRGGAGQIAWDLHRRLMLDGYDSSMVVGKKFSDDLRVHVVPGNAETVRWISFFETLANRAAETPNRSWLSGKMEAVCRWIAQPRRQWDVERGIEDFNFHGSRVLLSTLMPFTDLYHLHNLHGDFFDLRVLPMLSRRRPVIITMHDAWLISGHCAHSLGCDKWQYGCGDCPYLWIYYPIARDASRYNWNRKRSILMKTRFIVVTPSRWLMEKVNRSFMAQVALETHVIHNGVDLEVFLPADKMAARRTLHLPPDAFVMISIGGNLRRTIWKDWKTSKQAYEILRKKYPNRNIMYLVVGQAEEGIEEKDPHVKFVPYVFDRKEVATFFSAADVYIHAARAETFPNSILEAMACGLPCIGTAVGGIPEQIRSLIEGSAGDTQWKACDVPEAVGILVPPEDPEALSNAVAVLLEDEEIRLRLGENAVRHVRNNFDVVIQYKAYKCLYDRAMALGRN